MLKKNKKTIINVLIIVVMFGIFKSFMGGGASNQEVKEAIQNGATLVDVRSPQEFASGSVPGAVNIPVDKMGLEQKRLNKNKTIVVFCRSGNRSAQAKQILESNGFKSVINGGTWQNVNSLK